MGAIEEWYSKVLEAGRAAYDGHTPASHTERLRDALVASLEEIFAEDGEAIASIALDFVNTLREFAGSEPFTPEQFEESGAIQRVQKQLAREMVMKAIEKSDLPKRESSR